MSIGSTANTFKSKLFTGTILVCGKEVLEQVEAADKVISITQGGNEIT